MYACFDALHVFVLGRTELFQDAPDEVSFEPAQLWAALAGCGKRVGGDKATGALSTHRIDDGISGVRVEGDRIAAVLRTDHSRDCVAASMAQAKVAWGGGGGLDEGELRCESSFHEDNASKH